MENKTKILAFAAVALMFAVCFIGFVAISDDAVDAEDAAPAVEKGPLGNMCPDGMTYADDKYTLTKDVTVTLTDNVSMNNVKFVGKYTLTITSEAGKYYTLTVNYDFGTKTDKAAGEIFEVSSFVLDGANLNVIQKDTGKTEGPKSNQAGCSVFGTGSVEVKDNSTMTITTNEFANRVFYNNGSSLSINGENAKVILEKATSSTVSLSMTDGATLEIKDPLKTAGNFYPNINNNGKECKITVKDAADGNHGLFFYGTNSNAKDATNGAIKNCVVESDGIVGFYSNGSVDATGSTFEAKELVVAKSSVADMANVKGATFNVTKVGALNPNDGYKLVNDKKLYLEDVTFEGNVEINSVANVTLSDLKDDITVKGKVGALTITGRGNESVSIELDSAKTLCISNVKNVTVDGGTFTADSYVKVNGGESVVNISNVKETVSVKNVTINAKGDVKGQGISIMNCDVVKIVVSDNKICNAGHHSIMIGSVFGKLETLNITNNTFSEWGCNAEYSSAIHMFGKADSSVKAAISNNTFTCEMKDSSRLGKIISIGYQNGNKDGDSMGAFNNPVLFTKNVVNGKATDDFSLVVEKGATTYLDFGTKYAGKAISSVRQDGINHKAISYGNFTIENGKMMDVGTSGSIIVNGIFELAKGAKLTMHKDSIFTGTILGPDGNKLVANGMKAGEGGITITGGSLIINGKIMKAGDSEAGVTVTVTGNAIKVEGTLESGATMVIEEGTVVTVEDGNTFSSKGTVNNNGVIDNKGTITNDGVLTNDGTIKMTGASEIKTNVENNKVVNNGVVVDERAKNAIAVPVTNDGTVVAKNNADEYKSKGVDVVEQDPDKPVATEGKIEVNTNKYAFITPITTTGKLDIVMNDGNKQYVLTIPEGTQIAAGTVLSVTFPGDYYEPWYDYIRYQIETPGITNFSAKLPVQSGYKSARVFCDGVEQGVSNVRYNSSEGYVTFDAVHNSEFTIVLSNASPVKVPTVSGGDTANDYSLVIAFIVLVASLGFLAYVIKKR